MTQQFAGLPSPPQVIELLAADFAVLMEPTDGTVEGGCKGTLRVEVRTKGIASHSARPWVGHNAIHDAGVVHRIIAGDEYSHFELAEDLTHHHHHLVCTHCGRVEDFVASDELERNLHDALDVVAGSSGFTVQHHRLDLVGTCADCT